ncbi:hypothetical protein V6N13_060247 [Hibiscus sabdariffa]|uniref:DUF3741 domain-containing protein n=1 Tax=Hibiscus sabdariffa TaxID=183260 RepID=A0ABR2GAN7_9ROSI
MGRDWYWRSGAKPSNTHSTPTPTRTRTRTTLPGCIAAVFHLFQSHRFHFPLKRQASSTSSRGFKPTIAGAEAEAPRNCLDSASLASSTSKEDDILSICMGIQIKTNVGGGPNNDTPGTKTPTLVARLMGLDLLPEIHSPSFQSQPNSSYQTSSSDGDVRGGTRSLPVTPRTSSARRSDVDRHHPRLSLQIDKENMSAADELIMSRLSSLMERKELRRECETVKQRVTRKVGMNITNREELVSHFKHKKISRALTKVADNSSSKLPESKTNSLPISSTTNYQPFSLSPRIQKQTSHKLQAVKEEQDEQHKQQQPRTARKCKKGSKKKLEIIRNKKEPFVRRWTANGVNIPDKKCRKTPLSNDLLDGKVPTLVLVKKIPQKQFLPWVNKHGFSYMDGCRLMDKLCSRIRSFPRSDCRVLEDIDALIGRDTPDVQLRSVMVYEEQGEGIVAEIEKDMLEALVFELVVEFGGRV